ncbi:hypothetical protein RND71_011023 [Anisodus tanguticus]|uniref:Oligopeptide transporter n=1 Tax=Anisodus tanguticus TaxID=243964 RepID=A0AAE1SI65_9SOLA|nr:hypothetical protein RND71_011023 [Anisodus tanguticus]
MRSKTEQPSPAQHEKGSCSVEEVSLVVPETDDPNMPVMTFRALEFHGCNTSNRVFTLFGKWGYSFSLNPGPFSVKEHVIVTVMANCGVSIGGGDAYSIGAITVMKAYYKQSLSFICALLIVLTVLMSNPHVFFLENFDRHYMEGTKSKRLDKNEVFPCIHGCKLCILHISRLPIPNIDLLLMVVLGVATQYYSSANRLCISRTWRSSTRLMRKSSLSFRISCSHPVGNKYDTTKVLTPQFDLNVAAYEKYSKLYLSPLFTLSIGSGFARFTATLSHVALFHGSDIWKQSRAAVKNVKADIHTKLMQSYKQVPQWWFLVLLIGSIALSLTMSFVWKEDVQLPWWGMLFAFFLAWFVTLPIGVIQATTNQQPGYDIIGTMLQQPGYDIIAQFLVGILVAGTVNLAVTWWMLGSIENICDVEALHPESPWTFPKFRVTFDASVIWGLIGPERLFGPGGLYRNLVWLFLIGAVLPVPIWILSKIFPEKKWIPLINIPVISYGFAGMPPATPTNIASWLITGTIFNFFLAALDAGTVFMGVLLFFALQNEGGNLKWWGTELDHCPLASCPTAPGVIVQGCPVFK